MEHDQKGRGAARNSFACPKAGSNAVAVLARRRLNLYAHWGDGFEERARPKSIKRDRRDERQGHVYARPRKVLHIEENSKGDEEKKYKAESTYSHSLPRCQHEDKSDRKLYQDNESAENQVQMLGKSS